MIDKALAIAARPEVTFCSFGDMLRVPGTEGDLLARQGEGRRCAHRLLAARRARDRARRARSRRSCSSPSASRPPRRPTPWRSTSAPREGLGNFSMLVSHVLVPPAMEALLAAPTNRVQGFLAAGHVCTVMGYEEYEPLAARYRVPIVVTGFEPLDILRGRLHVRAPARARPRRRSRTNTPSGSPRRKPPRRRT